MTRIEITANRSVEADMFDFFKKRNAAKYYTKIPVVQGVGSAGPRMGDHIWPEENFLLIIYCAEEEARNIREAVGELKKLFPKEGIRLVEMPGARVLETEAPEEV